MSSVEGVDSGRYRRLFNVFGLVIRSWLPTDKVSHAYSLWGCHLFRERNLIFFYAWFIFSSLGTSAIFKTLHNWTDPYLLLLPCALRKKHGLFKWKKGGGGKSVRWEVITSLKNPNTHLHVTFIKTRATSPTPMKSGAAHPPTLFLAPDFVFSSCCLIEIGGALSVWTGSERPIFLT